MQQWFMDYSRASHVADNNGQRAFALVNKATGQALVNKDDKLVDGCVQVSVVSLKMKVFTRPSFIKKHSFTYIDRIAFLLTD